MKGSKALHGNPFRDGLTSLPSRNQPVPIKKIQLTVNDDDTDERNPSIEHRSSNDSASRTLSFSQQQLQPSDSDYSADEESSQQKPLHLGGTAGVGGIFREKSLMMNPRLALSAFRRPENAFRLTKSDPSRLLEAEYDLHAPKCGVLGHGAYATVRLGVRRADGVPVAIKTIAKHEALRSRRLRIRGRTYLEEWEILRRMNHNPYIVSLLDVFESDEEIQLVTEYCRGGELFDAIQKKRNPSRRRGQYTEAQASRITKQLLHALADLHAHGLVHRDVKPENILLDTESDDPDIRVKLCDFGMARVIRKPSSSASSDGDSSPLTPGRTRSFSMVGSDYYMAPEACFGGKYDTAVDIYSLGVTLYILLCGFPPVFSGDDSDEVCFPSSYWKDISEDAKDLVRKMMLPDVTERITARQSLQHAWMLHSHSTAEPSDRSRIDLVRQRLYNSLAGSPSTPKRPHEHGDNVTSPRKRRYERRASATLMALADLYRGVASSPSVAAIAAGSLKKSPTTKERKSSFTGSTTVAALSF